MMAARRVKTGAYLVAYYVRQRRVTRKVTRGGFSRRLFIWLRSGAYLGLELKALNELLEDHQILGVNAFETFDCLLDII